MSGLSVAPQRPLGPGRLVEPEFWEGRLVGILAPQSRPPSPIELSTLETGSWSLTLIHIGIRPTGWLVIYPSIFATRILSKDVLGLALFNSSYFSLEF